MGIEATYEVVESDGKLVELPSGTYFCYGCNKFRKTIPSRCKGTIEPCKCGSTTVYTT